MKKEKSFITPMELQDMLDDNSLSLTSYLQRRSDQWDEKAKGLLIHSMLADFIIPPLYFAKTITGKEEEGNVTYRLEVVDGLQRITVVLSYIDGEFSIGEVPPVKMRKQEVDVSGLYFCDLPIDLQEEIKRYKFDVVNLDSFTDEEIEDMFYRVNNGRSLTKIQQSKATMGRSMAELINELLERPFFKNYCQFSELQYRRSADQLTLIQGMCLLDYVNDGYQFKTISESEMFDYATSLRDGYGKENTETLRKVVDYLDGAFQKKNKELKKINIPILMVTAKKAVNLGVSAEDFGLWFDSFCKSRKSGDAYAGACSSGSIKKDNTLKRIKLMGDSFEAYYNEHIANANTTAVADEQDEVSQEASDDAPSETPAEVSPLYLYGMRARGFSPMCQPMYGFVERQDSNRDEYYDVLVYNRELSDEEIAEYELDRL